MKGLDEKKRAIKIYDSILSCRNQTNRNKIIRTYFKFTNHIINENNVAYKNSTCFAVSLKVRKNLKIQDEYVEGDILICRKRFTLYKQVFNTNFKFTVTKVSPTHITLDGSWGIPITQVRNNFIYSYCRTCRSLQGKSMRKPITIFDYDYERVTNEWLYVAISRCTDLNNVTFSDYLQIKENEKIYLDTF